MPKIFELFGFPLTDNSPTAESHRRQAKCPFMGKACDGGGNRYLSSLDTSKNPELKKYFKEERIVPAGVCSLDVREGEQPWIVCPRRLLTLDHSERAAAHQADTENRIFSLADFYSGAHVGVWSEVKIKANSDDAEEKSFDYTFDYVLMPLGTVSSEKISRLMGESWRVLSRQAERAGYQFAQRNGIEFIEDFPVGKPLIIEIMTSSTSGGDKKKRTQIPMAFEDAILGKPHGAPGINYRQVWARMVSQLIVKSEVAIEWGGKTIWILQDNLADYISNTTALDLKKFLAKHTSEVNILCFGYGKLDQRPEGPIKLRGGELYAGPISKNPRVEEGTCFQDIIRTSFAPPIESLVSVLIKKKMTRMIFLK